MFAQYFLYYPLHVATLGPNYSLGNIELWQILDSKLELSDIFEIAKTTFISVPSDSRAAWLITDTYSSRSLIEERMSLKCLLLVSQPHFQSNSIIDVKLIENFHGEINRVDLLKLNEGVFVAYGNLINVSEFLKNVQDISLIELLLDFRVVTGGHDVYFQHWNSLT